MRAKLLALCVVLVSSPFGQAMACAVCSADPTSTTAKSMASAIWFLMAAVMSVLSGIGLFSLHLWRHSRMPLEPHQQLTEEDLTKYD